jgi:pimeloyl-ACP methyl ester carboxylesterase
MNKVRAKDGTLIAYLRQGHGPAILLVHGTAANHTRWNPILPALQRQFTVYAMDRRGCRSGVARYRMEDDVADVAAVIDAIGQDSIVVVGHSYGAICALETALRRAQVRRLILYEPPLAILQDVRNLPEVLAEMGRLVAEGDREGALNTFYARVAQIPPRDLSAMRTLPDWGNRVKGVHTVLWELESMARYQLRPDRFRNWQIPALLLLGGNSPPAYRAGVEQLHAALPRSRIAVLEGQDHMAMKTAPKLFAREIVTFLKEENASTDAGKS